MTAARPPGSPLATARERPLPRQGGICPARVTVGLTRDRDGWDAYVTATSPDRLYHQWVWREVIEASFGHQPFYLAARGEDRVCGILPLFLIRRPILGNALISLPFATYGGVLADSPGITGKLLEAAAALANELGVRYVELRQGFHGAAPWVSASPKVTMEVRLPATQEEYLARLSSGRRKRLRYILRNQFQAEWGGLDALATFYRIFATNMRNLGTPVYPREFFVQQLTRMPERVSIVTLHDGGRAVATAFLTAHGETLEMPWAASLPASHKREAPMVLYWGIIRQAIEAGFRTVDLGRCTPGSGSYDFKRHWKPVERPLQWYYWLRRGTALPNLRPDNSRLKLAVQAWKRLPLAVANRLGPRLAGSLP